MFCLGYHDIPQYQDNSFRRAFQSPPQGGNYGYDHHAGSQTSLQMQLMGDTKPIQSQPRSQPPLIIQPKPWGHANTDVPGHDKEEYLPSIESIIIGRSISTFFILLDVCLNWLQYANWVGHIVLPDWLNILETANVLHGDKLTVQCNEGSPNLTQYFLIFITIGTLFGLLQIVSMVGETLLEYQKRFQSENSSVKCKGFQFMHGFTETLLSFLCDDLPQIILLVCFTWYCYIDYTAVIKAVVWHILKYIKNGVRIATCKQKYKRFCQECSGECCKEPCCSVQCWIEYFCGNCKQCRDEYCCCCQDNCFDCSDCLCMRADGCCSSIDKDPKWAYKTYENLQYLYALLIVAFIIMSVFKILGILHGPISAFSFHLSD
ncbi:uncharacterized protein LOC132760328 [Ruditapes philippinarum]|uniref:uncharacterized protein LOC132760328 n=1 Tax=Ruditapes philippinarum TaxID=129788 RepID=UPI00295BD7A4|nr:uncharacterized protein LOC132760328 [Ruditapes philippinarum]